MSIIEFNQFYGLLQLFQAISHNLDQPNKAKIET